MHPAAHFAFHAAIYAHVINPLRLYRSYYLSIWLILKGTLNFAAQLVEDGPKLEKMTSDLREYLRQHPPMTGAFNAKVLPLTEFVKILHE
ncbi:unnamed protein product [Strongylus vulgaris]|uniref:Uncharacterized protein n=1 Tax=Strongylus vulgaris TaxID=40348 RepID=A0A3P7JQI7_STRVU|nr:unnamed protein product [Strongylus vulgaris]